MKRTLSILLLAVMMLSLAACAGNAPASKTQDNNASQTEQSVRSNEGSETYSGSNEVSQSAQASSSNENIASDTSFQIDLTGITTLNELEMRMNKQLEDSIESLDLRWEELKQEVDSYEVYCDNSETVSTFYLTIAEKTKQMCIMLYEYSTAYARMVLDSDLSADDKYNAIGGINDCLYEDACDKIHDEVYESLLNDMNDYFYEGILDDAEDDVDYSAWYDVCSDEYEQWYDTSSEVYSLYYDASSDIYSFYYDMSSALYNQDSDRAEKVYERFLRKIEKAKGIDSGDSSSSAIFDTTIRTANSIEELENVVDAHVNECVQALKAEWGTLSTSIDTFDKYMDNVDTMEEFHTHIEESTSQIFAMICNYGVTYAELILQSGFDTKDMYKAFDGFKDYIYDDACEIVKDEIYEDLLSDVKDYYYDGVIKDAKDSVEYSDWSDARGDAYSWWSDTRGEVYSAWSDTRGELYSFYADMRSELYSGDVDGANDELQSFKEKYDGTTAASLDVLASNEGAAETEHEPSPDGIRQEFKEAMDSYEAFYTEYCDFMESYSENPADLTLLTQYADMLAKAEEMNEAFEAWDEDDLSSEELKYYLDVNNRVMKMLVDVAD